MSSSGITFSGLASGLDTQAIITALLAVEQRPIQQLESRKDELQEQLRLFGTLESHLSELRDAAAELRLSSSLLEYEAKLDDTGFLTASAGTGAAAGTYTIDVESLAKSQTSQSGAYASSSSPEVAGANGAKLTFTTQQGSFDVELENATYTLDEIAAEINAKGQDVIAQVLQISAGDYRLVVTGEVGAAGAFTVTGTGTASIVALGDALSTGQVQAASDASVAINGITIQRSSNSISDAIPGVTLDLISAHPAGDSSQLTVTADSSATAAKVSKLVDEYNELVDFIEAQSELDEENKPESPLFGDSTLRTIRSTLRGILGRPATTGNPAYSLLSQIGITSDREGKLSFDTSKFDEAVAADEDAVVALLSNPTNGIARLLYDQADSYLDSVDGLIVARRNGFTTRIANTENQIERAERRLESYRISLERKFANLETLIGRLQSQGAALGGIALKFAR